MDTADSPAGLESAPAGLESAPAGFESAPAGFESAPAGLESAPAGFESTPAGFESGSDFFPTDLSPIGSFPTDSLNATSAFPPGWPSTSPDFVLESLHELHKSRCHNEKRFYRSYSTKWEKLDAEKRQKTFVFFSKLQADVKAAISEKATEKERAFVDFAKTEASMTTKHDKARVLHLFADPRLVLDWQEAYAGVQDRCVHATALALHFNGDGDGYYLLCLLYHI
jgi:hypothetical protein